MSVQILQGNALNLPLADDSVDLIITSPPYFGLRSYQDAGEHYDGQIGSEATSAEFVDALVAATREMVRVVKPSGSIWVNLGDKYSANWTSARGNGGAGLKDEGRGRERHTIGVNGQNMRPKSLIGIPWRYALACIDQLGLILRAEIIWSKPNGLPESVTDRVRRSHETWFHFVLNPRYYSAVDEIREDYSERVQDRQRYAGRDIPPSRGYAPENRKDADRAKGILGFGSDGANPLGKLPGSVWTIPTSPLTVPPHLGVDHFAAFPMEWPRRIITGWSPREICTVCGEGRRPVISGDYDPEILARRGNASGRYADAVQTGGRPSPHNVNLSGPEKQRYRDPYRITDYACACPHPTAPATPGTVLDPFGGTGTTALVAHALHRHGINIDMSADYCRLARWRTTDPGELARACQVDKPAQQVEGQADLFTLLEEGIA